MHDPLGNSLMIEVGDFFAQDLPDSNLVARRICVLLGKFVASPA
jgi:hypothetical protein